MTYVEGIPTPYNRIPEGQSFYVWTEAAKAELVDLLGCSSENADLAVMVVRECAGRGFAHEPIRTQAIREAARAHRIYPGEDPVLKMRHALSAYLQTLNLAARLERGELTSEQATDRIRSQRQESKA